MKYSNCDREPAVGDEISFCIAKDSEVYEDGLRSATCVLNEQALDNVKNDSYIDRNSLHLIRSADGEYDDSVHADSIEESYRRGVADCDKRWKGALRKVRKKANSEHIVNAYVFYSVELDVLIKMGPGLRISKKIESTQ